MTEPTKTTQAQSTSNAAPNSENITIPADISFESAIQVTQQVLNELEQSNGEATDLDYALVELVRSKNGARGFFVTYLTGESPLADHPSPSIIRAIQSAPDVVADLLVKNLAMSSAMAIAHHRQGNPDQAAGSERVQSRTRRLIQMLQMPAVNALVEDMKATLGGTADNYQSFLQRWKYDDEQKQAIQSAFRDL